MFTKEVMEIKVIRYSIFTGLVIGLSCSAVFSYFILQSDLSDFALNFRGKQLLYFGDGLRAVVKSFIVFTIIFTVVGLIIGFLILLISKYAKKT